MAQYHAHLKSISRADGRSATGAIAYRAACKIVDDRTGLEFDFTKKKGVEHSQIFFPPGEENTRPDLHDTSALWNEVEQRETKSNAQVAREFEFSFPHELNAEQRQQMLSMFCKWLTKNHGVVAQGCIHAPHGKNADDRNYHAHILFSTRRFEGGQFTEKTREFSKRPYDEKELEKHLAKGGEDYTKRLNGRKNATELLREAYEKIGNKCLADAGFEPTLDRRSYAERGIDKEPTVHEGAGRAMSKRGLQSDTHDKNVEIKERNQKLSELHNEIQASSALLSRLDVEYRDLVELQAQMMISYEAEAKAEQRRRQSELPQPELTLDSMNLAGHIRYYYDAYSQDLIKRTKLQDEAFKSNDTNKALYYMQMKYESINHCLSAQDIEDLRKTKVFIKNDRGVLDALVQNRYLSNSEAESARRSVNNALTSCERTIERISTIEHILDRSTRTEQKVENTRNDDDYSNDYSL